MTADIVTGQQVCLRVRAGIQLHLLRRSREEGEEDDRFYVYVYYLIESYTEERALCYVNTILYYKFRLDVGYIHLKDGTRVVPDLPNHKLGHNSPAIRLRAPMERSGYSG